MLGGPSTRRTAVASVSTRTNGVNACSRCASIFSLAAFVLAEHRVGASILVARLLCHFVAGPKVLVGIKGMFWIGSEVLLNPHLILMLIIFFAFGASLRSECAGSLLGWF